MRHCHAFIDESGDFGLSIRSSKYVVMATVLTEEVRKLELIPRHIRRSNLGRKAFHRNVGLDFHSANERIRRQMLGEIMKINDVKIGSIVLDKSRVDDCFKRRGGEFYLRMCRRIAREIAVIAKDQKNIEITFDRMPFHYGHKSEFEYYILSTINDDMKHMRLIPRHIKLHIKSAEACPGIFTVGHIAGAIQKKYSLRDDSYYNIIKDAICFEIEQDI